MIERTKVYDLVSFKTPGVEGSGAFEALVSVYDNVDLQGDRVVRGAFENSLKRWRSSGDPIPVIWSHDWANPMSHIGFADPKDVTETDRGLMVKGQLDIESNPFAKQVYDLLKHRRVKEFSFAYDIQDERRSKEDGANELLQVGIIEVGPTLKGANPETELLAVKSLKDAEIDWVKAKMQEYGLVEKVAPPARGKTALKLEKMHDTLLALGYKGCAHVPEPSVDGKTAFEAQAQTEALGESAVKESGADKDLRLRTLLAEMSA